jgi:hypothetical protein
MHAKFPKEVPSFPTCFKLFSDSSRRRLLEEFMPFEARRYGSEDSNSSQAKAFSEETRRRVLVSNRGTWWSLGPPMLVLKHTTLRWWRGNLGLFNCYLFLPSGPKTQIGWLEFPFLKTKPSK